MIMPCMNSTSASERGGKVPLVVGGKVLLGVPGAPGCTTTGVAGSVCCAWTEEEQNMAARSAPKRTRNRLCRVPGGFLKAASGRSSKRQQARQSRVPLNLRVFSAPSRSLKRDTDQEATPTITPTWQNRPKARPEQRYAMLITMYGNDRETPYHADADAAVHTSDGYALEESGEPRSLRGLFMNGCSGG